MKVKHLQSPSKHQSSSFHKSVVIPVHNSHVPMLAPNNQGEYNYCEKERVVSNRLNGNKLYLSELRQKNLLKMQGVKNGFKDGFIGIVNLSTHDSHFDHAKYTKTSVDSANLHQNHVIYRRHPSHRHPQQITHQQPNFNNHQQQNNPPPSLLRSPYPPPDYNTLDLHELTHENTQTKTKPVNIDVNTNTNININYRTIDVATADAATHRRRRDRVRRGKYQHNDSNSNDREDIDPDEQYLNVRSRTMMVTSCGTRTKSSAGNNRKMYFTSDNLDEKLNGFMNKLITNENKTEEQQHFRERTQNIGQIHYEGVIPHSRRLNSFERRLKIKIRNKSLSQQKSRENSINKIEDLSKTLQAINMHQSPLVCNIEHRNYFSKKPGKQQHQNNPHRGGSLSFFLNKPLIQ